MSLFYKTMPSPVGELKLVASDRGLTAILYENDDPDRIRIDNPVKNNRHPILVPPKNS